jgi:hypothetical protein
MSLSFSLIFLLHKTDPIAFSLPFFPSPPFLVSLCRFPRSFRHQSLLRISLHCHIGSHRRLLGLLVRSPSLRFSTRSSADTLPYATYFPLSQDDLTAHAAFPRLPVPAEKIVDTVVHMMENQWLNGEDVRVDGGWRLVTDRSKDKEDPRVLAPVRTSVFFLDSSLISSADVSCHLAQSPFRALSDAVLRDVPF